MSFEQLFDFYKDFGLFPDIITLVHIKTIFNSLSEYFNKETMNEANKLKRNLNDFYLSLFSYSLTVNSRYES
jgi:hypothetical protein